MTFARSTTVLRQVQKILFFLLLTSLVFQPFTVIAQNADSDKETEIAVTSEGFTQPPAQMPLPQGLVSCFDFYTYGSVTVIPEVEIVSAVPGTTITIHASIKNANPHPIVDGMLYAKVFKQRDGENTQYGHDLIDQFTGLRDIALLAGETKQLEFEWNVPINAGSGEYLIATYFVSADRFNLAGLTFTDDITGGFVGFSVKGEQIGAVRFDRESVTVNGEVHEFATFIPHVEGNEDVVVRAVVSNTTDVPYKGTLAWVLYGWDGMRAETIVNQQSEELEVHPDDVTEVEYTFHDLTKQYPVYYVVGELSNGESKSIIDVRYSHSRDETAWARFNDVGVSGEYPTGAQDVAYACFQAFSGKPGANPQGTANIEVTVPGLFGRKVIAEGSYTGVLPYEFAALPITIPAGLEDFTVSASVYLDDQLVDAVDMDYSCHTLTPGLCEDKSNKIGLILLAGALIVVVGAFAMYRRNRGKGGGTLNPASTENFNGTL